jgi:hypothetical protein
MSVHHHKKFGGHRKSSTPPRSLSIKQINLLLFNVARSWETTILTLERCASSTDIILFQEPGWGSVRIQPSTTNSEGDMTYGPPIHPSWIPMTPTFNATKEDHPHPRVLTYVNKRLEIMKPQLRSDIIKHCNFSIVKLRQSRGRNICILNVYNNGRTREALSTLCNISKDLHSMDLCAGDFNIQDQEWDSGATQHYGVNEWHTHLNDIMSHLCVSRVDLIELIPTHIPTNPSHCPSVIDLLFVSDDIKCSESFHF